MASIASTPFTTNPELRLLLSDDVAPMLTVSVAESGGELVGWAPKQVTHQPGRHTVVQYRADVSWPGRPATVETIVAATGARLPDGATVIDDDGTRVGVWRWRHDADLPGLATALDATRVAAWLDELGVAGGDVKVRARAYRPTRRAVIEVTGRRGGLFLKVVRPGRAERLHDLHRALSQSLPVPDSLGWSSDGIVVLPAVRGVTLREALRAGDEVVPDPASLESLLDRLPASLGDGPRRGDLAGSAGHYAGVVAAVMPSLRGELDDVVAAIGDRVVDGHDSVPVHGDFYEAQLLVERGRIVGLVDVDTAGRGHRIDDLANMCAHLSVLEQLGGSSATIARYGAAVLERAEQRFDRRDLRARIAAGVVGLATGPFRVLEADWPAGTERRVALARSWVTD